MSDRSTDQAREWYVEIPTEFLPKGVTQAGCDLALLRSWAEIHRDHEFDHKMEVGASSILFLIDAWARLRVVLKERDEAEAAYATVNAQWSAASVEYVRLEADLLRAEKEHAEAIADAAENLRLWRNDRVCPQCGHWHDPEDKLCDHHGCNCAPGVLLRAEEALQDSKDLEEQLRATIDRLLAELQTGPLPHRCDNLECKTVAYAAGYEKCPSCGGTEGRSVRAVMG